MKKLSIEEKAKAYDKAIKVIKDNLDALNEITETGTEVVNIQPIKNCFYRAFPELKESEDKRMIQYFKDLAPFDKADELYEKYCFSHKDAIAWLEKQGTSYTKRDVDDAYLKGVTDTKNEIEKQYEANYQIRKDIATFIFNYRGDIKDRAKWMNYLGIKVSFVEKQGEQKLTEFEKTVKQVLEEAIECGDTHNLKADADMLLSLVHNSSWSEEDKKKVNNLYVLLDQMVRFNMLSDKDATEFKDWLKSLKHRVQPQNTWKPSDEQINVLAELLIFAVSHESPHWNDYIFGILENLIRQLKKLREE